MVNKLVSIFVVMFLLNTFSFSLYSHCKMNSIHSENHSDDTELCCTVNLNENKFTDSNCPLDQIKECECCVKQATDKKLFIIVSANQNLKESLSTFESDNLEIVYNNSESEYIVNYNIPLPIKDITILNENFRI